MKKRILIGILLSLLITACGSEPEVDMEATVAAALSATQTAVPTNTPIPPTNTPVPTDTPIPTDTPTPLPTNTPEPTETPTPTFTPTPEPNMIQTTLDSGDTLYEFPKQGFSFTLSDEWLVIDLESTDMASVIGAAAEQNESLSFLTNDYFQSLIASGLQFYAINTNLDSLRSNTPISINLIAENLPSGISIDQYLAASLGQLEQIYDLEGQIGQEQLIVDAQEIPVLTYELELVNVLGVPIEVTVTQYIYLQDDKAYIISLSMLTEMADTFIESGREAAESFRFIEQ